jgi:hypothetical protein
MVGVENTLKNIDTFDTFLLKKVENVKKTVNDTLIGP